MLFEENIRYPVKGDKLFIDKGNKDEIAWLNKSFQQLGSYADCYQAGAISLIDDALQKIEKRDYHIYPAVFLIRHYIELRLKEFIQSIKYCSNQDRDFPKHHNIQNLWSDFKQGYATIGEDINDARFKVIDGLIKELNSIDPISMSFRYPEDKNGEKTQKLEYVNLSNLRESFIRLCFVFDGISMQLSHYVDLTDGMMQEVYQHYWE